MYVTDNIIAIALTYIHIHTIWTWTSASIGTSFITYLRDKRSFLASMLVNLCSLSQLRKTVHDEILIFNNKRWHDLTGLSWRNECKYEHINCNLTLTEIKVTIKQRIEIHIYSYTIYTSQSRIGVSVSVLITNKMLSNLPRLQCVNWCHTHSMNLDTNVLCYSKGDHFQVCSEHVFETHLLYANMVYRFLLWYWLL